MLDSGKLTTIKAFISHVFFIFFIYGFVASLILRPFTPFSHWIQELVRLGHGSLFVSIGILFFLSSLSAFFCVFQYVQILDF